MKHLHAIGQTSYFLLGTQSQFILLLTTFLMFLIYNTGKWQVILDIHWDSGYWLHCINHNQTLQKQTIINGFAKQDQSLNVVMGFLKCGLGIFILYNSIKMLNVIINRAIYFLLYILDAYLNIGYFTTHQKKLPA